MQRLVKCFQECVSYGASVFLCLALALLTRSHSTLLPLLIDGNACLKAGYTSHNYDSSTSCCQWLEGEAVNVDVTCTPEGSGVQFQCSGAISVAPNSLLVVLLGFIAVAVQAGW